MRIGLKSMLPHPDEMGAIGPQSMFGPRKRFSPRFVMRAGGIRPRFGPGMSAGGSKQPPGSRVLGPARFAPGGYRVPTLRSATTSSPYLSSAYRRPPGQSAAQSYYPAATPGYIRAYSPAQSYMPAFNVQPYQPLTPQTGQPRMGRRMRRLYRLLRMAKRKGFRHWKIRTRKGKWVNRVSRKPYPRRRSKLSKKIGRVSNALARRGRRRQVRRLKRTMLGKPQVVGRGRRQAQQNLSGAYWGDLGNVGLGPGMF
jgi:hypothetical protein